MVAFIGSIASFGKVQMLSLWGVNTARPYEQHHRTPGDDLQHSFSMETVFFSVLSRGMP